MSAKHTPGPWRVFVCDDGGEWSGWPLSIHAESDEDKSVVRPGGQWPYEWDAGMSQVEALANARLIAAAPDLLEALSQCFDYPADVFDHPEDRPFTMTVTGRHLQMVRAALAKATGEQA